MEVQSVVRNRSLFKPSRKVSSSTRAMRREIYSTTLLRALRVACTQASRLATRLTESCSCFSVSCFNSGLIYPSPTYKVLTRTRNGLKVKKVDKDIHALSPQVTVKFVKRSANALKESTVSYSKKQVKQCISKANVVKKSLGSCLSRYTLSASSPTTSAATNNTSIASCSSIPLNSNKSVELNITATPMVTSVKKVSAIAKSSPTKTKPMYPERRREHNDSERKRRDHLRDAFHALRDQVPSLKDSSKKPARITILHEASSYVYELIDQSRSLEKTRDTELQKREKLLKKLALLKVKRLS